MTALPRSITPPAADTVRPDYAPRPPGPPAPKGALQRALDTSETPFTRWLVRWRRWFFLGIALLIVAQFNGNWRIGLDSSIYRGVADSLASGRGYTFAGRTQTQVYPGLPYLLAGLQVVFQTKNLAYPLLLMNGLALLTLWGVYQLIQQHYPKWVAVVVTCGVGLNSRFVMQAHEIMTDTPFLCAVVFSLLAWAWLGRARTWPRLLATTALLAVSLFVAATMRPTFWVLAAAWALTAAWNVVRYREKRSLIALLALAGVLGAFLVLDPRSRGLGVIHGAYEKQFLNLLPDLWARAWHNKWDLFCRELPEAFFSEQMTFIWPPFLLLLAGGTLLVLRRQPLWALQIVILSAVMLVISDVARYYLMVLPTLWLAYVLGGLWLTSRFKPQVRDLTLFALFSVANFQNLGGAISLAREQHAEMFGGKFIDTYKGGTYKPMIELARVIEGKVPVDKVVFAPNAQVLSYLSNRAVLNGRLLGFDTAKPPKYPALVKAAVPMAADGKTADLAFVVGGSLKAYGKKDADLYQLIRRGVIVPGRLEAWSGERELWLARVEKIQTAEDWRQAPIVRPHPVDPNAKPRRPAEDAKAAANRRIKQERSDRAARIERNRLKNARAERAERIERNKRKDIKKKRAAATQKAALVPSPAYTSGRTSQIGTARFSGPVDALNVHRRPAEAGSAESFPSGEIVSHPLASIHGTGTSLQSFDRSVSMPA